VARVFGVTRKVVRNWCGRAFHRGGESFRDERRGTIEPKVTEEIDLFIVTLRTIFEWGSARIQQGLFALPPFMYDVLPNRVRGVRLSRVTINNVLKRHKLNGYKVNQEHWKFFRAKGPDELWQLDLKGPVRIQGKRYWFLVCVDDYSRYLVLCEQFDHCPSLIEIESHMQRVTSKNVPKNVLTDNGSQFRSGWADWCKNHGITPLFAHPFYPQDKGKVERTIRNVAEEFTNLLKRFPQWLNGQIAQFKQWYNTQRFHRGINAIPEVLYVDT
jgi:transposase InsO family protein